MTLYQFFIELIQRHFFKAHIYLDYFLSSSQYSRDLSRESRVQMIAAIPEIPNTMKATPQPKWSTIIPITKVATVAPPT